VAQLAAFQLHPGSPAPPFSLPGVDGRTHSLSEYADRRFLLVVFWCNHCPYVQAWEGRMIAIGRKYGAQGVQVVLINSNDPEQYPDDGFDRMVARARDRSYPFPYLHDAAQSVAHAYGALVTPHPMLFGPDRKLLFQGPVDDHHDAPEREGHAYVEEALDAAIAGRAMPSPELPVLGCSVKWRT
jgi:peroxiredoxin